MPQGATLRLPLTGGCQCRALRYEIRAEPLTVYACHCTECQRQSASAFGLSMIVPRAAIVFTAGTPADWLRRHESGRTIHCLFCPTCGVRLFHNPDSSPEITIAKAGTLDDTRWLTPVGHIWTASAQPWFAIPPDTVNDAHQGDRSKLIEAWRVRRQASA